ncbi:hypothetical protein C8R43DRAFT_1135996 [Mycena crocata]|nr:hypothetical protein C8R43DRAFT_1135996 [Mycena crocata]
MCRIQRRFCSISNWLTPPGCPFHFSRLRLLSIRASLSFGFQNPIGAPPALAVFDFALTGQLTPVDLSCFTNLTLVRTTQTGLDVLSTIGASNIRKILLHTLTLDVQSCAELDATLFGIPLRDESVIVLTMPVVEYSQRIPSFSKSSTKLRFTRLI